MVSAYRNTERTTAKATTGTLIKTLDTGISAGLASSAGSDTPGAFSMVGDGVRRVGVAA